MCNVRCRHAGATLTELMFVVAIIGILAAIAIPLYSDYVARAQFSEGLMLAKGQEAAVAEIYSHTGICPNNSEDGAAGIPAAADIFGRYVTSVTTRYFDIGESLEFGPIGNFCWITARFREANISKALAGKFVSISVGSSADRHEPRPGISFCRTDVDERFVPLECRL